MMINFDDVTRVCQAVMSTKKLLKVKPKPRTPGRPKPEDINAIESKLLEVGLKEFLEQGYGNAAMARIAKAAGGSKTTLYSRYPSKEELFRAIIFDQIERAAPQASLRSDAGPLDLEQGLKSYANHMLEHSLQDDMIGVNKLVYSECYRFPELGAAAVEKTNLGIKRIAGFISESAVRDGVPCKNPTAIAQVFIFMIRGWYMQVLQANKVVSAAEREEWVNQAVNALLLARKDW